jgi:riboflavin synthase
MFTGIVTHKGRIVSARQSGDLRVRVATDMPLDTAALGASIACSGVCLTVVAKGADWFEADCSGETVARSAPGRWQEGSELNLERAMKIGDELGGHIVTGHVDGTGTVHSVVESGDSLVITFTMPRDVAPFVAAKGSITVDGVSLTVNTVEDREDQHLFAINLIPHTAQMTTLGALKEGDGVNLEIDVLARYLKRMAAFSPA